MAAAARLRMLLWFFLCQSLTLVLASPINPLLSHQLLPRNDPIINNITGEAEVFNPSTRQPIPQGPATDGGGTGFSPPAVLWMVFCMLLGIPMASAGIRGWRFTTGVGIGMATAVVSWAAFINSVNSDGVPDLLLTAIIFAFFFIGFILGLFEIGRLAGIALLGVTGGLAIGIRIMIIQERLLFDADKLYTINWVIIGALGAAGGLSMIWWQRAGITLGSASIGTFLFFLGLDLAMNQQRGMSRGLRFLFDRNSSHLVDILMTGYAPPLSTKILIAISLGLTPIFAYAQHRIFPHPFSRKKDPFSDSDLNSIIYPPEPLGQEKRKTIFSTWREKSRFSL